MLSSERKSFGIRPARKPQRHEYLAGVVVVLDGEGRGTVYIRFSEALVDAVGKQMPQGVGPEHRCYLKIRKGRGDAWTMYAFYLEEYKGVILWRYKSRPEWLNHIRRT